MFTRSFAVLVTVVILLAAGVAPAAAAPVAGGTVVVGPGETVDGIEGVADTLVVRGTVDGDIAGAFGTVRIAGVVTGDVQVGAGTLVVAPGGRVAGDIDAGAGTLRIEGTVLGDVTVGAGEIVLGEDARVAGTLRYDGDLSGDVSAVEGGAVRDPSLSSLGVVTPGARVDALVSALGLLVGLAIGALLLAGAPGFSARVVDTVRTEPFRAGGVGVLAAVAVPVALVLVAITVVGLPISIAGLVLFGLLVGVGAAYGRIAVGAWLLELAGRENRWLALFVGFLVVAVAVRVPLVGWLVGFAVAVLGLGALALAGNDSRRRRAAARAGGDEGAPATR